MRLLLLTLSLFVCLYAPLAESKDLKQDEIDLREQPQQLFNKVSAVVSVPKAVLRTNEAVALAAKAQGLSQVEFIDLLALLARTELQPNVSSTNKRETIDIIAQTLEASATTPYQTAMALMIKGRAMARIDKKFEAAAECFILALTTDEESHSLQSLLLRLNLYEQLGGLYLLINQDVTALVYLQKYRDLAYQLRNDYLIASSEAELGKYYIKKQELTKALQHFSEALRLSNKEAHPFQRAFLQMQLAKVYRELGQTEDALSHAHDAADTYGKLGVDGYLSATLTVIAMIHAQNNEWNKAIDHYLNAQQIDRRSGNLAALARNFHNLGEAYTKIGEHEQGLDYLQQANGMFINSKMKHFQVYSDQLLAETHCKLKQWDECQHHADIAFSLAKEQELDDVLIDSLKQKLAAAIAKDNPKAAIDYQAQIISLLSNKQQKPQQQSNSSALAEQKLKLDLHQSAEQLDLAEATLRERTLIAAGLVMLALALAVSVVHYRSGRRQLQNRVKELEQQLPQEQLTGHLGLVAFLHTIGSATTEAIGLIRLSDDNEADIELGHTKMAAKVSASVEALNKLPGAQVYVLRPGLLALSFNQQIGDAGAMLLSIRDKLSDTKAPLQFAYVNLPLLPNSELAIPSSVHLEVIELALAGACSVKTDNDIYVGFWALDFTPSAIFTHPVYLHLEKSIERGLIRIETNIDKDNIRWPNWQPQNAD